MPEELSKILKISTVEVGAVAEQKTSNQLEEEKSS